MGQEPGAGIRARWALGLNLIAPGVGSVVLRREWLGLALALLFALLGQVALWGLWITPATAPYALSVAAGVGAGVVWAGAQWLAWSHARKMPDVSALGELDRLRSQADEALAEQRLEEARNLLQIALAINDEDPELHARWGRLMGLTGHRRAARKAWRTVLKLNPNKVQRDEATAALEPAGSGTR